MDFLNTALYKSVGLEGKGELSGAVLTRFNPNMLTSRAEVVFVTADQLRNDDSIKPMGFEFSPEGILMSDTDTRSEIDNVMQDYVSREIGLQQRGPHGLIDLVMHGSAAAANVLHNYERAVEDPNVKPIMSLMSSYKVSNSSFNIYCPYVNEDNEFRTSSLVDISTNTANEFVMAVPDENVGDLLPVISLLRELPPVPQLEGYTIFAAHGELLPYHTFTGEAFINYLSYNVAYHEMGNKIIQQFMEEAHYVNMATPTHERREKKEPLKNVSITCNCSRPYTQQVLRCGSDLEALRALLKDNPEAHITLEWVQAIAQACEERNEPTYDARMAAACVALRNKSRKQQLHYALELLAQRIYISQLTITEDPLGPILRGGGVNGISAKGITW